MSSDSPATEAERVLRICGACMYCDGLCPVFPALSGKHAYSLADLSYLANLCHNCRACWYACQYAPPHPFAVNLPAALAGVRRHSYADHVWPGWLGRAFRQPALGAALIVAAALAAMIAILAAAGSATALLIARTGPGSFYAAIPWTVMTGLGAASLAWAVGCMTMSTYRFWRAIAPDVPARALRLCFGPALRDIVTLRHLGGGRTGLQRREHPFLPPPLGLSSLHFRGRRARLRGDSCGLRRSGRFWARAALPPCELSCLRRRRRRPRHLRWGSRASRP